jgi:hypothetical protein
MCEWSNEIQQFGLSINNKETRSRTAWLLSNSLIDTCGLSIGWAEIVGCQSPMWMTRISKPNWPASSSCQFEMQYLQNTGHGTFERLGRLGDVSQIALRDLNRCRWNEHGPGRPMWSRQSAGRTFFPTHDFMPRLIRIPTSNKIQNALWEVWILNGDVIHKMTLLESSRKAKEFQTKWTIAVYHAVKNADSPERKGWNLTV